MSNEKKLTVKQEQLLRNAYAAGMKTLIIARHFEKDVDMFEGAKRTEEDFYLFVKENELLIKHCFYSD